MNNLLIRILDRYELDKPILMHDKIDIIWDKHPAKKKPAPELNLTPEEEFNKVLKEMRDNGDSKETASQLAARKEAQRLRAKANDNVNHYAVKFKLGKRKIER